MAISRDKLVLAVRIIAFVLHAVMALVITGLMFACRVQAYTNWGYHTIALDWKVCLLAVSWCLTVWMHASMLLIVLHAPRRTGRIGPGPTPATARSSARAKLLGG